MTTDDVKVEAIKQKHEAFARHYAALQDGINERNLADRSKWGDTPGMVDAWMNQSLGLLRWAGLYADGHLYIGPGFVLKV